ncbi:MAG: hypothetical protein JO041_01200 [Acidobacteria bacterium]|nr:hypothetical protein [Acidobacteriota bacterium]
MKAALWLLLVLSLIAVQAQMPPPPAVNSPLLDRLAGTWVLRGTLGNQSTIHDVQAEWVVQHHYLRVHEVSREKGADGQPLYEALVFLTWNRQAKQYYCDWLDNFGGALEPELGFADAGENRISLIFQKRKGEIDFENDLIYDPASDAWEWRLDNISGGTHQPFARLHLTRK